MLFRSRAAFDIDGDGDTDVLATNVNLVVWFENLNGAGTSWSSANSIPSVANDVNRLDIGDLDGDGDIDFVGSKGPSTYWYRNDSGGTSWTEILVYTDSSSTSRVRVADFDRDGECGLAADLVAPQRPGRRLGVDAPGDRRNGLRRRRLRRR